jgi:23S rRNA (pseudouridine1915-N3)-methyltransferase
MPRGYEVLRLQAKQTKLKGMLPRNARLVALDERGRDLDTRAFSKLLLEETVFLIGGPDGLDEALKRKAAMLVRLSSLTLPHALAQVLLLEQLYRAATLLTGHPYHRV